MDKEPKLPASVPWDFIERSFGAALSREEQAKLEVWMTADPEHAQFVAMVRSAMASADSDVGKPDVNAIVAGTEERVRSEVIGKGKPRGRPEPNPQYKFRAWFEGVADWTATRLLGILGTPLSQEEADQMRALIARAKKEKI